MTGETDADCPVCLAPLARDNRWRPLHCEHWLHRECWDGIADASPKPCCPMCRADVASIICAHSRQVHNYGVREMTDTTRRLLRAFDSTIGLVWALTTFVHLGIGLILVWILVSVPGVLELYEAAQTVLIDVVALVVDMVTCDVRAADWFLRSFMTNATNLIGLFALGYGYTVACTRIVWNVLERI